VAGARWYCGNRAAVNVVVAAGFVVLDTALTLIGAAWWPARPDPLAWTLLGVQALVVAALVVRWRYPLTVVGLMTGFALLVSVLDWPLGVLSPANHGTVWAPFAAAVASYTPVVVGRNRRATLVALAVLTVVVARPWQPSWVVISIALCRTAVGPLLALYFDARRRLVRALTERAERAERERDLRAAQARADERARLAAEMHDIVTHRVSLMVLAAGALRVTAADEATRRAAEDLRATGCQALDELRDLVGILYAEPGETDPLSRTDLSALVAEAGAAGTPAELVCAGDPGQVSPLVGRTIYRVVREALTNVRKHAPGARITVRVRYELSCTQVTVHNTAPTGIPEPALAATGSGLGLTALRRRIDLVHGSLRAEPTAHGGFLLTATLPAFVPTAEPAADTVT
jgi:signal transduction histidine kinase